MPAAMSILKPIWQRRSHLGVGPATNALIDHGRGRLGRYESITATQWRNADGEPTGCHRRREDESRSRSRLSVMSFDTYVWVSACTQWRLTAGCYPRGSSCDLTLGGGLLGRRHGLLGRSLRNCLPRSTAVLDAAALPEEAAFLAVARGTFLAPET